MAKNKSATNVDDQYSGDDTVMEAPFEVEPEEPPKKKKVDKTSSDTVVLVHNRNTKKELVIGREYYTFWGRERLTVPRSVITHSDFKGQEKYFLIKEE